MPTNTVVSDADETVSDADTPASDDCLPTEDVDVSDSTGKKCQCDDNSLMIVGHSDETTLKYLPVCSTWQRDQCRVLGLEMHRGLAHHNERSVTIPVTQGPSS